METISIGYHWKTYQGLKILKMSLLYQISNVECKYQNASHAALKINSLDIKHGEIVFLIGASGVGKSTILETLGLMNNTLVSNSESIFNFAVNGTNEDFTNIWSKSEAYLSKIRKKHLSFIFKAPIFLKL